MPISDDDFWIVAQRMFAFDEPGSRAAQIKKLLAKHAKSEGQNKDVVRLSADELEALFCKYFAGQTHADDLTNALVNVFLALEYVGRFTDLSFMHWSRQWPKFLSLMGASRKETHPDPLRDWIKSAGLSPESLEWLSHNSHAVLDWRRLCGHGPWHGDARADFMAAVVQKLDGKCWNDVRKLPQWRSNAADLWMLQREFRESLKSWREVLPASFLPNGMILVEGPTEEILLPHFARCMNINFDKLGALVYPAGGANQVVRRYLQLREALSIPIFCLLDGDSPQHALTVKESLREIDLLFVLNVEEIEDVYELPTFITLINDYLSAQLEQTAPITVADVSVKTKRSERLSKLLNERGLPPFNKLAFAKTVTQKIRNADEVPNELRNFVRAVHHALSSR